MSRRGRPHRCTPVVDTPTAADSPLAAYLALPQIEYKTEWDALDWWKENAKKFPNLSVMARQYLGVPGKLGDRRAPLLAGGHRLLRSAQESHGGNDLRDIIFTKLNVE